MHTDTTVVGGTQYKYFVTAYNQLGGESQTSIPFEVTPITVPSGMAAPTRVTHSQTSITLQWAIPTSDGDSEVYRYDLYAKADFESSYV